MDPGLFVFPAALRGCRGHRAATLHAQRRSFTSCREAAPVLAGSEPRKHADVAQWAERDHAMVEATGSNPVFRSTFGCALAPPATRAPWDRRSGDVHGVAPHVQREDLVGLPITRAWTQPKVDHAFVAQMEEQLPCQQRVARSNRRLGHQTCRVRLAGQGCWAFNPATRVRIPYTTPDQKSCALTLRAETGRKDWAAPELVTGIHTGGVAQSVEHLPCKQDVAGSKPVASTSSWFVSSAEERLPVEERAAGSIPARTAIHAARDRYPYSSIGRAPVSKTEGSGFDSLCGCQIMPR